MSSIIEGYNYDIFISYRQKDNKGESWVSEFVEALKAELESTFKEDISLYFDANAHSGLLETHNVGASIKEKLKCLIFIPVLSRTYCDPKSFAWEHEYKSFVQQAASDRFGMMVKLPDSNVASRVLPVLIHDLDPSDIQEFESVLGEVLRGVQFIYKEPGVNRSLTPSDHEERNLNNTNYRNQINKVALAIKEILSGLKREAGMVVSEKPQPENIIEKTGEDAVRESQLNPVRGSFTSKLLSAILIIACLLLVILFAYPKFFKTDKLQQFREKGEISVAIMPFQNLTGDTLKNFWQQMIQENMVGILSNSEDLKVRQTESVITLLENTDLKNYASLTPSMAKEVSEKLEANVFVQGSVSQVGKSARLIARLVDSETEEIFHSFKLEGPADSILVLADSISSLVQDYLVIAILKKSMPEDLTGFSEGSRYPEAVKSMIDGQKAFVSKDYREACNQFHQAIKIDSGYYNAAVYLAVSYGNRGLFDDARKWAMKAYDNRDKISRIDRLYTEFVHSMYFGTPYETISIGKKLIELNDQAAVIYYNIGFYYLELKQYDKAVAELEKALKKYNDWGIKPMWVYNYTVLGEAYHELGMYRKEERLYGKAEKDFPGDVSLLSRQAILALAEGRAADAKDYIDRYVSIHEERSVPEATIAGYLGSIYLEAEIPDRAEEQYRIALELEPERAVRLNSLGYFLIDTDTDIDEGLALVEKALVKDPENNYYLDSKGWGMYKKGLYREALEILERAWELKPEYSHVLYLHLEAARKAVAGK
jgi:tetratricopeptide (TPR) repeat protein